MTVPRSDLTMHAITKWRVVAAYWAAQAVFVVGAVGVWIQQAGTVDGAKGRPLGVLDPGAFVLPYSDWDVWLTAIAIIAALMLLQAVLVWPVRRPRFRRERGWPLWLSVGAGALAGTVLAVGIALAALNLFFLKAISEPEIDSRIVVWAIIAWCLISYVTGFVLLTRFCSRRLAAGARHETILARIASTLFVGTLVEAVAIMPLDVMYRRKADCYCSAGTFWAYTFLTAAGLVTLGPAIFIPALARRRKRWYAGVCDCCGYDMSGLDAKTTQRCPECGAGWRPDSPLPDHCSGCGYDLAGIAPKDGAIGCPECGLANPLPYAHS